MHRALLGFLVALVAAGCAEPSSSGARNEALETRLDQIDARLARIEHRLESMVRAGDRAGRRARRLAAAMERRAQRRAASGAVLPLPTPDAGAPPGQAAPGGSPPTWLAPDATVTEELARRQEAFAALAAEYRSKLARLRERYGEGQGGPEWQAAINDLQEWYRERVSEVMASHGAAGPAPAPPDQ